MNVLRECKKLNKFIDLLSIQTSLLIKIERNLTNFFNEQVNNDGFIQSIDKYMELMGKFKKMRILDEKFLVSNVVRAANIKIDLKNHREYRKELETLIINTRTIIAEIREAESGLQCFKKAGMKAFQRLKSLK